MTTVGGDRQMRPEGQTIEAEGRERGGIYRAANPLPPARCLGSAESSSSGLWDVRYTAIHSWVGTTGILVE